MVAVLLSIFDCDLQVLKTCGSDFTESVKFVLVSYIRTWKYYGLLSYWLVNCLCRMLEDVPETTWQHFKDLAENLVKEKDAVSLLSSALAIISGNADMKPRSLLSSREVCAYDEFKVSRQLQVLLLCWHFIVFIHCGTSCTLLSLHS